MEANIYEDNNLNKQEVNEASDKQAAERPYVRPRLSPKLDSLTKDEMQKRVNEVSDALAAGRPYLCANIYPKLEAYSIDDEEFSMFKSYADGCYLLNVPFIQSYIVKDYQLEDDGRFYAIAEIEGKAYGFFFDQIDNYPQYISLNMEELNNRTHKDIEEPYFELEMVSQIGQMYQIPYVEAFPYQFKRDRYEIVASIMSKSEYYLKTVIYPKIQDRVEWADIVDYLQGSVLVYNQEIREFMILEQYRVDDADYLVFEKDHHTIYYFTVEEGKHGRKLMRYGSCNAKEMKKCEKSGLIGKTIRYAVAEYDILPVYEITKYL